MTTRIPKNKRTYLLISPLINYMEVILENK